MSAEVAAPTPLRGLAARGAVSLIGRQAVAFLASTVCSILLARLLTPSDFGAYAFILFAQGLAKILVDGGLTATLVRQAEEPSRTDWRAVFTFQIGISTVLAVALALAPLFFSAFSDVRGFFVANLLAAASIMVSPVLSIGFARLERALRFDRLGFLGLAQPVAFSILAPVLAKTGIGVVALGVAMLLSTVVAVVATAPFVGVPPRLDLHLGLLRERFRFGGPYIASGLISTVKDAVNPVFVGIVVGAAAVGYIRWSQQVAALSIYLLGAIGPMLFALFARVRDEPERLGRATSMAIFWANTMTAPLALLLTIFIVPITTDLYGDQWLPAIPLYFLLAATNLISPTTTVLLALCNSLGKPGVPLAFALIWFAGTWLFTVVLVRELDALGFAVANVLVQVFGIALIVVSRRFVTFSVWRPIALPWALAVLAVLPAFAVSRLAPNLGLGLVIVAGAATLPLFAGLLRLCAAREFAEIVTQLRSR